MRIKDAPRQTIESLYGDLSIGRRINNLEIGEVIGVFPIDSNALIIVQSTRIEYVTFKMDYISEASDSNILAAALLSDLTIVTLSSHSAESNIARQLTLITIDYAWKTFNVGQAIVFDNQVDSDLTEDELPTMVYKLSVIENADTVYFWFTQPASDPEQIELYRVFLDRTTQ